MSANSYWKSVLQEVLNKEKIDYEFRYTSVSVKANMTPLEIAKASNTYFPKRSLNRYALGKHYGDAYLTQREFDCMRELLMGQTVRQAAGVLILSPRTVEFYLKNLKVKFLCRTRIELEKRARQSGLFDHLVLSEE